MPRAAEPMNLFEMSIDETSSITIITANKDNAQILFYDNLNIREFKHTPQCQNIIFINTLRSIIMKLKTGITIKILKVKDMR